MNGDRCRCDHLWEGHRRRGSTTVLRGKCLAAGCKCENFFGALAPQAPRFPVITRTDPSMVREYGERGRLTQSPFEGLAERLHMDMAMTGSAEVTAEELDAAAAEELEYQPGDGFRMAEELRQAAWDAMPPPQVRRGGLTFPNHRAPEVIEQMEREGLVVPDNIKAAAPRVAAAAKELRIAQELAALTQPPVFVVAPGQGEKVWQRYPLEDWSAWYCRDCRHTGRPEDHTDCPHPLERVRVQVIPDGEDRT